MLRYQDQFDWATNIFELSGALAAQVRVLEEQRARVESGPNHPDLKRLDLVAIDAKLVPLTLRAQAAVDGVYLYDPRDVSGADPVAQCWASKARERGMLVHTSQYEPSIHASDATEGSPLHVIRGGNGATNLGSPTFSSRG